MYCHFLHFTCKAPQYSSSEQPCAYSNKKNQASNLMKAKSSRNADSNSHVKDLSTSYMSPYQVLKTANIRRQWQSCSPNSAQICKTRVDQDVKPLLYTNQKLLFVVVVVFWIWTMMKPYFFCYVNTHTHTKKKKQLTIIESPIIVSFSFLHCWPLWFLCSFEPLPAFCPRIEAKNDYFYYIKVSYEDTTSRLQYLLFELLVHGCHDCCTVFLVGLHFLVQFLFCHLAEIVVFF